MRKQWTTALDALKNEHKNTLSAQIKFLSKQIF